MSFHIISSKTVVFLSVDIINTTVVTVSDSEEELYVKITDESRDTKCNVNFTIFINTLLVLTKGHLWQTSTLVVNYKSLHGPVYITMILAVK